MNCDEILKNEFFICHNCIHIYNNTIVHKCSYCNSNICNNCFNEHIKLICLKCFLSNSIDACYDMDDLEEMEEI